MAENPNRLHIVMFPWLAFGHMIPFLELSKLIAQKGHKISFISTPRNIDRLPKPPPSLSQLINFVKVPLPRVDKLPIDAESTTDLPYHSIKYLKIAYDGLREPVSEFLHMSSPDWVFFDFAPYWVPTIASELNIATAYFNILNVSCLGFMGPVSILKGIDDYRTKPEDFTVPPKWIPFKTTLAFRLFEILRVFNHSMVGDDENVRDLYRLGVSIEGCDILTSKSCSEFEPEWIQLLRDLHKKPVIPVGLLPSDAGSGEHTWGENEIQDWFSKQNKGSVLYIAFGSEAEMSQNELTEIALGLELSEIPFFWVLRKQAGLGDSEWIELPIGFEERTKGRGVVWTSWAPQVRILSHDSVGGFLTHGGWGSIVDGIQFGKPLVVLTFLSEQGLNARILEEKKLGYTMPRDELDGSFTRGSVAKALRLVLIEEKGEIYRTNAKEMSQLFSDRQRQHRYVDYLLEHLVSHKKKKNEANTH